MELKKKEANELIICLSNLARELLSDLAASANQSNCDIAATEWQSSQGWRWTERIAVL